MAKKYKLIWEAKIRASKVLEAIKTWMMELFNKRN